MLKQASLAKSNAQMVVSLLIPYLTSVTAAVLLAGKAKLAKNVPCLVNTMEPSFSRAQIAGVTAILPGAATFVNFVSENARTAVISIRTGIAVAKLNAHVIAIPLMWEIVANAARWIASSVESLWAQNVVASVQKVHPVQFARSAERHA